MREPEGRDYPGLPANRNPESISPPVNRHLGGTSTIRNCAAQAYSLRRSDISAQTQDEIPELKATDSVAPSEGDDWRPIADL